MVLKSALTFWAGASLLDGPLPIGETIGGVAVIGILGYGAVMKYSEHTKNKRKSTKNKHENANARRQRDRGGEKKKQKKGWKQRGGKKR